jgi:hypothetical protein
MIIVATDGLAFDYRSLAMIAAAPWTTVVTVNSHASNPLSMSEMHCVGKRQLRPALA